MLAVDAGAQVKQHGLENYLLSKIKDSEYFASSKDRLNDLLKSFALNGKTPQQVFPFI